MQALRAWRGFAAPSWRLAAVESTCLPSSLATRTTCTFVSRTASLDTPISRVCTNGTSHTAVAVGESVTIALGSNIGDRLHNIRTALSRLSALGHVTATSFLYETHPMHMTDQPLFLNAVVAIRTQLAPLALLTQLKSIEADLGREMHAERYSSRPIDLDIVTYAREHVCIGGTLPLDIPHPRAHERQFVLRPLVDVDASARILNADGHAVSAADAHRQLFEREGDVGLVRVVPTRSGQLLSLRHMPLLVGVATVSPSGGGERSLERAIEECESFLEQGFDIVQVDSTTAEQQQETSAEGMAAVVRGVRRHFPDAVVSACSHDINMLLHATRGGAEIVQHQSGGRGADEGSLARLLHSNAAIIISDDAMASAVAGGAPRWALLQETAGSGDRMTESVAADDCGSSRMRDAVDAGGEGKRGSDGDDGAAETLHKEWYRCGAVASSVFKLGGDVVRLGAAGAANGVRVAAALRRLAVGAGGGSA